MYCFDCKTTDMKLKFKKHCEKCNGPSPSFNYPGQTTAIYCKSCADEVGGMENVINDKCIGCNILRPSFNNIGENKPLYCNNCKKEGMINVNNNKCLECQEYAWYNFENEKKFLYCIEHKKEGMISLKNDICIFIGCEKHASYNYENENKRLYCGTHALPEMVNVAHNKCIKCNEKRGLFNYFNEKSPLYCSDCKEPEMVRKDTTICKTHLCGIRVSNTLYKGYCYRCYCYTYPNEPISRNFKTKENAVKEFIENNFHYLTWTYDSRIIDGCSLRRPDFICDLGFHVLIVEVDENQHRYYEEICENKRLMQISQDIYHRNLVLIKFNPDGYNDNKGNHTSCWTIGNKGDTKLKSTHVKEWERRLKKLEDTINYWIKEKNKSNKMIEIDYLYYDEKDTNQKIKVI